MLRAHKAERITRTLDSLVPNPPIPLDHRDPFTLLVAVLLSAQCTDVRVNQVTPKLFELGDTPQALQHASVAALRARIRPCGLSPQKARHIKALAAQLVREHAGQVPNDLALLEQLPGVGHKTASVVISQAFGVPAFPVDTHIHRLAWRWGISNGSNVTRTEADLKRWFPREQWNRLHLQFITFGRAYCRAVKHAVTHCPICCWAMSKARARAEAARRQR